MPPRAAALPLFTVTVTVYRSEGDLPRFLTTMEQFATTHAHELSIECVFVVDGSPDGSLELLKRELPGITAFRSQLHALSRNFGATSALRCALAKGRGEYFAPIPPDLQEPPELLLQAMQELRKPGIQICLGVPVTRKDPALSRLFSRFYWLLYRLLAGQQIPRQGIGFFAIDRQVRNVLVELPESNSFLVGLLLWLGYGRSFLSYEKQRRPRGKSSWTLWKKLNHLLDSVFSFSLTPIRLVTLMGLGGMSFGLIHALLVFTYKVTRGIEISGYSSTIILISLFGGANLLALGILGEYIGRILCSVQERPLHLLAESHEFPSVKRKPPVSHVA